MSKKVSRQVIISRLEKQKREIDSLNFTIEYLRKSQSAAQIQQYAKIIENYKQ